MRASRVLGTAKCGMHMRPMVSNAGRQLLNQSLRTLSLVNASTLPSRVIHPRSSFTTVAASSDSTSYTSSSSPSSSTFTDSDRPKIDSDSIEYEILNRALTKVQLFGWTDRAILAAIEELGYSSSLVGLFPRGSYDLVDYFMRLANHNSLTKLSSLPLNEMSFKDKLELALKLRLEEIIPYASSWPQAMAIGATPKHLKDTMERIYLYIDDVLYMCGDKSTNLEWYTHRASLFSVYVATELYMSTDRSANYAATWNFLHKRIQNVSDFHSMGTSGLQMADLACSFISNVACSAISSIDPRRR